MSSAPHTQFGLATPRRAVALRAYRPSLRRAWPWLLFGLDATMVLAGGIVAGWGASRARSAPLSVAWMLVYTVVALWLIFVVGLYRSRLRPRLLDDSARLVGVTTLAAASVASLQLLAAGRADTNAVVREWAFVTVYLIAGRIAVAWSAANARRSGFLVKPTLIVGRGEIGALVARRLYEHPELGLRPVAFLDKEPRADVDGPPGVPVVGASWDLDSAIDELGIEQIVVAFSTAPDDVLLRLLRRAEARGIDVAFVPRFFERVPERISVEHLGGLSLLVPRPAKTRGWQFLVKHGVDRSVAAAILFAMLPIFAGTALAVAVTMGRPIFFRQRRVGRDGKPFEMLKFRSMCNSAVAESTPFILPPGLGPGGVEGADRRTAVGRFLRGTNIDELPQLVNVLKGEMSLVGPRPERPEFVERFEREVYRYGERHRVKAGITGWAQVHGLRGRTSIADRAEWDNFYIENFSLWLDMKILLLTVSALAQGLGCREIRGARKGPVKVVT
jgi:exopolysaccharide biosynthesis polyprenyl glycosylphosphotransferase